MAIALSPKDLANPARVRIADRTVLMIVAIILVTIVFASPLLELVHRWNQQEEYSHGFLIPVVTLWLLWKRRDALRANSGQPSWSGAGLIALSLVMYIVGELSAALILAQMGFIVALFGIVVSTGGYAALRVALIPLAFLLFAIPWPHFVDAALTLRLQHVSSQLGVWIVGALGIPVYLDGNIVDMGNYKLQVVEACSGLRYLYPLLSLSFLAAYLFHARIWQRVVVFLSSIPIAIGMNGLRIGMVGFLVDRYGTQMADGVLHLFEGWVIFVMCSVLLVGEMYILTRVSGKSWFEVFHVPEFAARLSASHGTRAAARGPLVGCVLLICIGGAAVITILDRPTNVPQRTRFVEFPVFVGEWQGHPALLDLQAEKILNMDDYILSHYSRAIGEPINLYVAYYARHTPHSPSECIPAGGWEITDDRQINYGTANQGLTLNRVIIDKDGVRQLVYYWFDEHGRTFANQYWARLYRLVDGVLQKRNDGALVRLVTQIRAGESDNDADQRLQSFMQVMLPRLTEFLPSAVSETRSEVLGPSAPSVVGS